MSSGDFHGVAIRGYNSLWSWGQLGEDAGRGALTVTNRFAPVQIGTNSNWLWVGGGYQHSVACDTEGALWAWGFNAFGEVGDGTQLGRPHPTQIASSNAWLAATVGGLNHVAVRMDGTLWNWSGVSGQFTGEMERFRAVMPGRRFRAVAAGDFHSVALDEAGAIWTWGKNDGGQLGDGTATSGLPRQIATNIVAADISAGANSSFAVDLTGQMWMWGYMAVGQSSLGSYSPIALGYPSSNF